MSPDTYRGFAVVVSLNIPSSASWGVNAGAIKRPERERSGFRGIVLRFRLYVLVSFLRGQLTNLDTQFTTCICKSKPSHTHKSKNNWHLCHESLYTFIARRCQHSERKNDRPNFHRHTCLPTSFHIELSLQITWVIELQLGIIVCSTPTGGYGFSTHP
jgi:hypothetical protein